MYDARRDGATFCDSDLALGGERKIQYSAPNGDYGKWWRFGPKKKRSPVICTRKPATFCIQLFFRRPSLGAEQTIQNSARRRLMNETAAWLFYLGEGGGRGRGRVGELHGGLDGSARPLLSGVQLLLVRTEPNTGYDSIDSENVIV